MADIGRELFEKAFPGLGDAAANRLRADVARADRMGMRAGVFAKVGDSNLASYNSLYGLGCRQPVWDRYQWLEPTMLRYREIPLPAGGGRPDHVQAADRRKPWNSFSRSSAATRSGLIATHLQMPSAEFASGPLGWTPDPDCRPEESMVSCEIRLLKPRFVFVNVGTNGAGYGLTAEQTADQVSPLVEEIKRLGPVPIVFTIPPQLDSDGTRQKWSFAEQTNDRIAYVAREAGVLLFNQWLALADGRLVNHGMVEFDQGHFDGFHLETPGGFRAPDSLERSVDFRPAALLYGANLRNLLLLWTLQALDAALQTSGDSSRS